MKLLGKKGVSPLVATVLLIAFAVALGAVVMNWGRGYVEEAPKAAAIADACSGNIQLNILDIAGKKNICLDEANNKISFRFENSGSIKVDGFKIQLIGVLGTKDHIFNERMEPSDINSKNVDYFVTEHGQLQKARLIPKVGVTFCPSKSTSIENIQPC